MYMSDFWGGLKCPEEKYNPIEKLHFMACKQILGVQKQTTNIGILLELGRVPLQNFAIKAAVKNWERIELGKINEILKKSHSNAILDDLPWITHIKSIIQTHNLENLNINQVHRNKHPFIHNMLHKKQCEIFHQNAFQTIKNPNSKLRTYALFKTQEGCEKYLHDIKNAKSRQSLTKFRLSNHMLNIEKGRHTTPKTPKELRFCPFCPNKVEDEVHFLLICPTYRVPRTEMINTIARETPSFLEENTQKQFTELMKPENSQYICKTIENSFEIRQFLLGKPKGPI